MSKQKKKKMKFIWTENEILILEKASLRDRFFTFSEKQSKFSRCFPVG